MQELMKIVHQITVYYAILGQYISCKTMCRNSEISYGHRLIFFVEMLEPINVNYFLGNILDSSSIFPFLSSTFTSYSNIIDYCTMCMDLIENGNMFSKQTCL